MNSAQARARAAAAQHAQETALIMNAAALRAQDFAQAILTKQCALNDKSCCFEIECSFPTTFRLFVGNGCCMCVCVCGGGVTLLAGRSWG